MVIDSPGPPRALRLRDLPVPEPGPGQARIKVAYAGLNPMDVFARAGKVDWMGVTFPFTPGLEHTGIVDAVGEGVPSRLVGRRVLSRANFGGCADYSLSDAASLIALDDRISLRVGCVYRGCTYTAWHLLHKAAQIRPDQWALFHSAAGPVGIMLTQIAKEAGLQVIGLAGGPEKTAYAAQFGADAVLDYSSDQWVSEVLDLTSGRGVDLVVDGNGGPQAKANFDVIAPLGKIYFIGISAGDYPDPVHPGLLIAKNCSVAGFSLVGVEVAPGSDEDRALVDAVVSGRWRVPISDEVPLEDTATIHEALESRRIMGRAVICVDSNLDQAPDHA